jgi:type I site-specific restriction endonuclease
MKRSTVIAFVIAIVFAVMLSANSIAQPQKRLAFQQEGPAPTVNNADPFWGDWLEAQRKDAERERLDDALEDFVEGSAACSNDPYEQIARVLEVTTGALDAQNEYLKKWLNFALENSGKFKEVLQNREGLRLTTQRNLETVETDIQEMSQRIQVLGQESQQAGLQTSPALDAARKLLQSQNARRDNLQQALADWQKADLDGKMTINEADRIRDNVRASISIVESMKERWQAYYSSMDSRLRLKCWRNLRPQEPKLIQPKKSGVSN